MFKKFYYNAKLDWKISLCFFEYTMMYVIIGQLQ